MDIIFNRTYEKLMRIEGGYSNNPNDSGAETYRGISRRAWPDWIGWARVDGYKSTPGAWWKLLAEDKTLQEHVKEFYRVNFWQALKCDEVALISVAVAVELFDTEVNCRPGLAASTLQRCLNTLNNRNTLFADLKVDGDIGGKTLAALDLYLKKRAIEGETVLLTMQNCLQGAYYIELAERREKDEEFVYGWFRERVRI